jgi:hypothetical protein
MFSAKLGFIADFKQKQRIQYQDFPTPKLMKYYSKLIIYPTMKKYGRRGLFGSIEGQSASHASTQNHAIDDSSGKISTIFL